MCLGEDEDWPALLSDYPALRIEKLPPMGPPQVLHDFSAEIIAALDSHQAQTLCADPGGDDGGGDQVGDDGMDEGSGAERGEDEGGETGDAGLSEGKAGCACDLGEDRGPGGLGLALLGLACLGGAARRGRRRP